MGRDNAHGGYGSGDGHARVDGWRGEAARGGGVDEWGTHLGGVEAGWKRGWTRT